MTIKRDKNGRFIKGSKSGAGFTSTRQPRNNGRKKSRFKQILGDLADKGEPLSREDLEKTILHLYSLNVEELKAVAHDKNAPIALIMVASAIIGDIDNKATTNADKLFDRVFGRATHTVESKTQLNVNSEIDFSKLSTDELKQYHDLVEKANAKKE